MYFVQVVPFQYTALFNTFLQLNKTSNEHIENYAQADFQGWFSKWMDRISIYSLEEVQYLLSISNPKFIPRNHLVEEALHQAANLNDFVFFNRLLEVLQAPYMDHVGSNEFKEGPQEGDGDYRTYCGT